MATTQTIDTQLAKQIKEARDLQGVSIIGVPGGWTVLVTVGMSEMQLGTQQSGRVRKWRSLDTLISFLRDELGIVKIDGIDAGRHYPAKANQTRPDVAGGMHQAHAGLLENWAKSFSELKGMVPAPARPVSIEAMGLAGALASMPNVGEDEDFARQGNDIFRARLRDDVPLVSRSKAKQLIARFDRFKTIILDFKGVQEIGQAFSDELFRVYGVSHPDIDILPKNMTEPVERMRRRVMMAHNTLK